MKKKQLLRTFQRLGIVLVITAGMVTVNLPVTYALSTDAAGAQPAAVEENAVEDTAPVSETVPNMTTVADTNQSTADEAGMVSDTGIVVTGSSDVSPTTPGLETDANQDSSTVNSTDDSKITADDSKETGGAEAPDDSKETDGTEVPDDSKETDGTETPDDSKETDGTETPDDSKETDGTETPDDSKETDGTETPDGSNETDGTETPDDSKETNDAGAVNLSPQENAEVPYMPVIQDYPPYASYIQPVYDPSKLPDKREKVKYNLALPIDGIPSFITQEMIIGALKCQDETGYPASVTIAQIIQESGYGVYGPGGEDGQGLSYLAYQYCNLFGIKGTGPAGSVDMLTGEQTSAGADYTITAGFRVYHTYTECLEDRTELLREVYSDLTENITDANTFAMKIGSRWATSLTYSQNLIQQMETYDLYRLDDMTLEQFSNMIGTFANPCPGASITSEFGYRSFDNSFHKGLDLGTGDYNIPTYAADEGTVVMAGWSDTAGNWVIIDHGNGLVTKYMHHDKIYVEAGQHIEKGQQIGLSGTTGNSTGNHLHFQVEENGVAVNPMTYLAGNDTSSAGKQ